MQTYSCRVALLGLAMLLAVSTHGCRRQRTMVRYIVGTRFNGVFVIQPSASAPAITTESGTATIRIPECGVVYLGSLAFLERWHAEEFSRDDGTILPDYDLASETLRESDAAARSMFTDADQRSWYIVAKKWQIRYFTSNPHELFAYAPWNGKPLPTTMPASAASRRNETEKVSGTF